MLQLQVTTGRSYSCTIRANHIRNRRSCISTARAPLLRAHTALPAFKSEPFAITYRTKVRECFKTAGQAKSAQTTKRLTEGFLPSALFQFCLRSQPAKAKRHLDLGTEMKAFGSSSTSRLYQQATAGRGMTNQTGTATSMCEQDTAHAQSIADDLVRSAQLPSQQERNSVPCSVAHARSVQLHGPRRRNWQTVLQGSMQGQGELDIPRLVLQPSGRYYGHVWFKRVWMKSGSE
jgi:hypothetical protein